MGRILRPDELGRNFGDFDRRLQKLERAPLLNVYPLISTPGNSANQNQTLPGAGNMDGVSQYDVTMLTPCRFTLSAPQVVIWRSYVTLKLSAPGGGNFAYLRTAVSLSPWNNAAIIFYSGTQLFDKGVNAYINSVQEFVIAYTQIQGAGGPGAPALGLTQGSPTFGPLPAGTYEVRQQITGDAGLQAAYYQGNIDVYAPGG